MRFVLSFGVFLMSLSRASAQAPAGEAFFETKIRPVLAEHCWKCHSSKKTSGGLRLDLRERLMRGGESGAVVVPGQPEKSRLIAALQHRDGAELKMPPTKKLPDHVIADFASWVKRGAIWPAESTVPSTSSASDHWAFQPARKPAVPAEPKGWAANPIDCFILAKLQERGLRP